GIPRDARGTPTVCAPDPHAGHCQRPYHDAHDENAGGPHSAPDAIADIDAGRMDGFVAQAEKGQTGDASPVRQSCGANRFDPRCSPRLIDVMGYHDRRELPSYWSYADRFVLQDHLFEP